MRFSENSSFEFSFLWQLSLSNNKKTSRPYDQKIFPSTQFCWESIQAFGAATVDRRHERLSEHQNGGIDILTNRITFSTQKNADQLFQQRDERQAVISYGTSREDRHKTYIVAVMNDDEITLTSGVAVAQHLACQVSDHLGVQQFHHTFCNSLQSSPTCSGVESFKQVILDAALPVCAR